MLSHLHHLSKWLFYLLAGSFFLTYLFHKNELFGVWPRWWLEIADLPLAVTALLFGGTSLYQSVTRKGPSTTLAIVIGLPLTVFFVAMVVFNFWL